MLVPLDLASRETSSAQRTSYGFLQDASDSPVTLLGVAGVAKWLNVADVIGPGGFSLSCGCDRLNMVSSPRNLVARNQWDLLPLAATHRTGVKLLEQCIEFLPGKSPC